jgi:HPt (histidine-containing phosphotransfer) domain-containing protein
MPVYRIITKKTILLQKMGLNLPRICYTLEKISWRYFMADEAIYVNFDDGVKRVMNNVKLYVKLLGKFKTDTNVDELEAKLAAGDMENAQIQAHTIKGIAANLSLMELFKQMLELETQIKARSVAPGQIGTVKAVYAATVQEVDKVMAQYA